MIFIFETICVCFCWTFSTLALHDCNDMPMVGHFGVDETRELVFRRYRWPHLCNFVEGYKCSCNALCQIEESATLTILVTMTIANSSQLVGVYLFGFHCRSDSLVFHESMPFGCTSLHQRLSIVKRRRSMHVVKLKSPPH